MKSFNKYKIDKLNVRRDFNSEAQRRDYFTFYRNREGSTYEMSNKQMDEWEESVIKKIVRIVCHSAGISKWNHWKDIK